MLASLKALVEGNPTWFLVFFGLSVVANLLQILSYFNDRRRTQQEAKQREEDRKRLSTYQFLFERADKQVATTAELKTLEEEISKRSSTIPELEKRIELLREAAKREVVAQNIDRNITIICDAYEELQTMRADHSALGTLPDLPDVTKHQIEAEVRATAKRPFELPKSLIFRCLLLVLFIMLLPWPVDTVLVVVFLHIFLIAFFSAANLSRETEMTDWITRRRYGIGLGSAIGSWYMLIQAINSLLLSPLDAGFGRILTVPIAALAGIIHWRTISSRVLRDSLQT